MAEGDLRPVSGIKPPAPLVLTENPSDQWKTFKQKWGYYGTITKSDDQPRNYQVAMLLHTLGDSALKVYNGFTFGTPETERTVEEIIAKFDKFAVGTLNETYERYLFNSRDQKADEPFETFHTAIRSLSKTCNYCENCINSIIRDRIVLGIRDENTQLALLKETDLTLDKCIDVCKTFEHARTQGKVLSTQGQTTHKITYNKPSPPVKDCKFCGKRHIMKKEKCPAWGKTCSKCKELNHFAHKCPPTNSGRPPHRNNSSGRRDRRQRVHGVQDEYFSDDSDDTTWLKAIHTDTQREKPVLARMKILEEGREVTFEADSGATSSTIPQKYVTKVPLEPTQKTLTMWNKDTHPPLGTVRLTLQNPKTKRKYSVPFIVVKENFTPLLSLSVSVGMGLITVNEDNFERANQVSLSEEFSDVFEEGLGTLAGEVHLEVDPQVRPVIMPARKVPLSLRPKLKAELDRLTELKVISPVDEPTPWVNQMAVAEKRNGKLRVCLDPRELNKALKRERYSLPILEEHMHLLSQSTVFTKVDLSSAYWHVQLDEPSRKLTTFQSCFGDRYQWNRLPFGLSVCAEIFGKKMTEALLGLPGVLCIADDAVIHGRNAAEHDDNLRKFLQRCQEKGLRLNKDKFAHKVPEISFMGHTFSAQGMRPDPEKVRALTSMASPQNIEELRRFMGMVNYLGKYLPNLATVSTPLRNLMKKEVPWTWSESQESAIQTIKKLITEAPVLGLYDATKDLILENDASDYGLGSCLMQEGKPIAFASRSLTDAETRYAQIEKELLAVVFGLEKFHYYTYGRSLQIITDHKPLVAINAKPLSRAPRRLQSLLLRTQKYDFELVHRPGKSIPVADALSRAPMTDTPNTELTNVNAVSLLPIKETLLAEIRQKCSHDNVMTTLKSTILQGWPAHRHDTPEIIRPFYDYRDELTVQDGIILRGEMVVIPSALRADIKCKVHAGHQGINSCLRRARQLVYWPGMSKEIRQFVESCSVCATYADQQPPETLNMHDVPERPWQKVGTDLFTFESRAYLVTVDYYSRFFEIDYLPDTLSETVISKMKHHFARHGIPDTLISDGGPQYTSDKFKSFTTKWAFNHTVTTPGNSKANGAAEATVKIAKRLLRRCQAAHEDPYLGLLNIRNTPTEGLVTSPVERLFGRKTKSLVPTTSQMLQPTKQNYTDRQVMEDRKASTADRLNQHRRDLPTLKPGDTVRMQPIQRGQSTWKPATVQTRLSSREYEVQAPNGRRYVRNRQFLRSSRATVDVAPDAGTQVPLSSPTYTSQSEGEPATQAKLAVNTDVRKPYCTRSGRQVIPPKRYT